MSHELRKDHTDSNLKSTITDFKQYSSSNDISKTLYSLDYDYVIFEKEKDYEFMYYKSDVGRCLRELHDVFWWNSIVCASVLAGVVAAVVEDYHQPQPLARLVEGGCNTLYALHVAGLAYMFYSGETKMMLGDLIGFCVDFISFTHFLILTQRTITLILYGCRLHRALKYIFYTNDFSVRGSILGTCFKIIYMSLVLRVGWTITWMYVHEMFGKQIVLLREGVKPLGQNETEEHVTQYVLTQMLHNVTFSHFCRYYYDINKMFLPLGTSADVSHDFERVLCLLVMVSGCLMMAGAAVAAMSLVFCIHMTPEESFRARYRLIMKELEHSNVSPALQHKVQTFYMMYWEKQNAVSTAELLSNLPPSLVSAINYDIYFKAMQKSKILRDLPNYFLTEVAKVMTTMHYIPGDTIIARGSKKSTMYYITYGDVEMLTPEDDSTAVLRMARGSVLAACSGCALLGCGRALVAVRAATYCTAQRLDAVTLWRHTLRQGKHRGKAAHIVWPFYEHLEKVKMHYETRPHPEVQYLSSILHFKQGLIALKKAKDKDGKLLLPRPDIFLEIAGCYLTRSHLEDAPMCESDEVCLRQRFPCVLQPASSLLRAWDALVAALTLAVCIAYPYFLTYKESVPLDFVVVNHAVTLVYLLDLIVFLSTGASVEEGVAITFTQTAVQQMRRGWFVLHVIAVMPIFEFIGEGHFAGLNKLIKLPQMFNTVRKVEESCVYHAHVLRFCVFTLLMCILCYLIAAFKQGITCFKFDKCEVTNFTHLPYWESAPLNDDTVREKITFSLYWAISLLSFTSHMDTYSYAGMIPTIFILEFVLIIHIFIEAVYSATIMVTSDMRQTFDMYIQIVKDFLIRNSVDPLLRQRFITYLELCWLTDQAYSITNKNNSIFFDLPPHVSQDIISKQCSSFIVSIPFMKLLSQEDLKAISYRSQLFYTSPGEVLLHTGHYTEELMVIKKGMCEVLCPVTCKPIRVLSKKGHFGVLECLLLLPAYYTIRAVTHVEIIGIKRKTLIEFKVLDIPQIKYALEATKNAPECDLVRQHPFMPFIVYKPQPQPPNREKFKQRRKYESDKEFLEPFTKIGFLSILRYVFPRFTLRPDGVYLRRCEWLRAACALAAAMLYPCHLYLSLQFPILRIIAKILDYMAYFDIMQRTLVGYFNDKGILIYHPASTLIHYLRSAFIVDLIACLPLEDMQPMIRRDKVVTLSPLRQFLMLNRLVQLYRFFYTIDMLNVYLRKDIVLVLKALPLFTTMCNVLTLCIVNSSVQIFYSENIDKTRHYTISTRNDSGGNWIHIFKDAYRFNMTENVWNLHLATYFWVIYESSTTGYKTINPTNYRVMEILFAGMITSAMITTYFSVRVISERANVNQALCAFQEHKRDIQNFMEREELEPSLQKRVNDHYDYNWDNLGGVETRSLLKMCKQVSLRTDIIFDIYGDTFVECPVLPERDVSLLRVVARGVQDAHAVRGTPVFARDDTLHHLYLVNKGVVSMRVHCRDTCSIFKLGRGSVFGNLERDSIRSPHSAVARTNVHLLKIKSKLFHDIISNFPAVTKRMAKHRPNGEMYVISASKNLHPSKKPRSLSVSQIVDVVQRKYNKKLPHINLILIAVTYLSLIGELFNIGFQNNTPVTLAILYTLDVCFILKILVLVHIPNTKHKQEFKILRKKYLTKKYFKMDILSCVPVEGMAFLAFEDTWLIYSWLRINRFFRIVTLYKCVVRRRKRLSVSLALRALFSVFVWFSLFVHAVSCLFHYVGTLEDSRRPRSSWKYSINGNPMCGNEYVCAVYFILSSFIQNGLGDIMPRTHSEVIFVALLAIVSTMVLMIYVGEFSNLVQYHSFRSFDFYSNYLQLKKYLKNNRVSDHLVSVVKMYCLHLWRESRGYQLPHFLTTAPQPLRLQIMSAAYIHHLKMHPVFKMCEPAFLRQLAGCFTLCTYNDELQIVQENEITDAMYFIHKGSVLEYTERNNSIRIYRESQCFGQFQGLHCDKPFEHSYRSIHKSQILALYQHDWKYLLQLFPESRTAIFGKIESDFNDDDDNDGKDDSTDLTTLSRLQAFKGTDAYNVGKSMVTFDSFDSLNPLTKFENNATTTKVKKRRKPKENKSLNSYDEVFDISSDEDESTETEVPSIDDINKPDIVEDVIFVKKPVTLQSSSLKLEQKSFVIKVETFSNLSLSSEEDLLTPGFFPQSQNFDFHNQSVQLIERERQRALMINEISADTAAIDANLQNTVANLSIIDSEEIVATFNPPSDENLQHNQDRLLLDKNVMSNTIKDYTSQTLEVVMTPTVHSGINFGMQNPQPIVDDQMPVTDTSNNQEDPSSLLVLFSGNVNQGGKSEEINPSPDDKFETVHDSKEVTSDIIPSPSVKKDVKGKKLQFDPISSPMISDRKSEQFATVSGTLADHKTSKVIEHDQDKIGERVDSSEFDVKAVKAQLTETAVPETEPTTHIESPKPIIKLELKRLSVEMTSTKIILRNVDVSEDDVSQSSEEAGPSHVRKKDESR